MKLITAKEFSAKTGYPLKTIRNLCMTGKIPCAIIGRSYLLDIDIASECIKKRMYEEAEARQSRCAFNSKVCRIRRKTSIQSQQSYLEALDAL